MGWTASMMSKIVFDASYLVMGLGDVYRGAPLATPVDSPVSGSVWEARATVGDTVASGNALVMLESMKMELTVTAQQPGVVTHIIPKAGDHVGAGQVIVVVGPEA